jgi:hypothetical protein
VDPTGGRTVQTAGHIYLPISASTLSTALLIVRTDAEPRTVLAELKRVSREADRRLPAGEWYAVSDYLDILNARDKFLAFLTIALSVLATLLATGGAYAGATFMLSRRHRELVVRSALGASKADSSRCSRARPSLSGLLEAFSV